jgi:hypothetical protein
VAEVGGGADGLEAVGDEVDSDAAVTKAGEAGPEAEQARAGASSGWVAARVVVTGLGAIAVVCALATETWVKTRGPFVFFVIAGALAALWWPPLARAASLWAAGLALTAAVLLVSGMGRTAAFADEGQGAEVAGYRTGEVPSGPVLGRMAASDLPPSVGYTAGIAAVGLAAGAVSLALARLLGRGTEPARSTRRGVVVGVLVTAALVPAVVVGGSEARKAADRRAEADSLLHEVAAPAERLAESPGPVEPSTERWEVGWPERYGGELQFSGVVAVPGWDAMVGYVRSPSSVVAFSKTDGSELWRYGRRHGLIGGITVDPEAGRVLVLSGEAAIVLDLRDGSELRARPLPFEMDAPGVLNGGGVMIGPDYTYGLGDGSPIVAVGPSAMISAYPTLAVVDVARGEVVASFDDDATGCRYGRYAATATPSPVIVRWGLSVNGAECGNPTVLVPDDEGGIEPIAEIEPPSGASVIPACSEVDCGRLAVTDDAIVLFNQWTTSSGSIASEIVVLSTDGTVRWRTPVVASDASLGLAATTDTGVITYTDPSCAPPCQAPEGHWRLLSLADGTELARQPNTEGDLIGAVTDDQRLYVLDFDGVTVRRLDDLALVGTGVPSRDLEKLFATAGLLIVVDDTNQSTVAYGEGSTT